MTLTIAPFTSFGLLFLVVCFVFVFDQTLVEHLYKSCDKGLLLITEFVKCIREFLANVRGSIAMV